ncbi:MAG: hypothetical protein PHH49_06415 [Candidatus Omnitrophica bacterium]|nr:hypothetical protein [Candidatus Omnitrophota bacterium]MDD5488574.1 hypothetical protein [Candidatus Omnitrophota bacterium]
MLFRICVMICLLVIGVLLMNEYISYDVVLSLNEKWMPLSSVMDKFGYMKISDKDIKWSDGQASEYEVVHRYKNERVIALISDPLPSFDGKRYKCLRFTLKDKSKSIWEKEIEVDFCKDTDAVDSGLYDVRAVYIMEHSTARPLWMKMVDVFIDQVRKSIKILQGE